MAKKGSSAVYRVTEVIGTSATRGRTRRRNAVKTAASTLRDLRIAEITKLDVQDRGRQGRRSSARACRFPSSTTPGGVFTAVVRISGAGRLADFRERLRWLMVRDPDAEDYTEHHAAGVLEYRFAAATRHPVSRLHRGVGRVSRAARRGRVGARRRARPRGDRERPPGRAAERRGRTIRWHRGRGRRRRPARARPGLRARRGRRPDRLRRDRQRHTYFRYSRRRARAGRRRRAGRGARGCGVRLRRRMDLVRRGRGGARARALRELRLPGARREPEIGEARPAARAAAAPIRRWTRRRAPQCARHSMASNG